MRSAAPGRHDRYYEIAGRVYPASGACGDFVEWVPLGADRLAIIVGDASGEGLPAALSAANLRTRFGNLALRGYAPAAALADANEALVCGNADMYFVTLFYAVLDSATGDFSFANAGHVEPLLMCRNETVRRIASLGDPALGVVPSHIYRERRLRLSNGESIIVVTDGVTEAVDSTGRAFGDTGLMKRVAAIRGYDVDEIVENVLSSVFQHRQDVEQRDDIGALVLRYTGRPARPSVTTMPNFLSNSLR